MNLVEVFNSTRTAVDEQAVALVIARALGAEGVAGAEVAVQFVGERRIRALNAEHRRKDEVTDVLSFPLEDADGEGDGDEATAGPDEDDDGLAAAVGEAPPRLLGDIVICMRRAVRQARADGLPESLELAVLLVHGTLHLLGYDHEVDAGQMALRQAEILECVDWEGLIGTP